MAQTTSHVLNIQGHLVAGQGTPAGPWYFASIGKLTFMPFAVLYGSGRTLKRSFGANFFFSNFWLKVISLQNDKVVDNWQHCFPPGILLLNLQSVGFSSLSPSLFETCNCSYLQNYFLEHWHGFSARINLMFWCVAVSHCTYVDIHCTLESQILHLRSMTQIRIFTGYCHLNK